MKQLSEVIKLKKGEVLTDGQQALIQEASQIILQDYEVNLIEGLDKYEYLYESSKKRALTISSAYNIFIKLYLSVEYSLDFFKGSIFEEHAEKFSLISSKLDVYKSLVESIFETFKQGSKVKDRSWLCQSSVTLAWLEAYYKSGFFPADESILSIYSLEHKKLVDEVENLAEQSIGFIKSVIIPEFIDTQFNIDLYSTYESIKYDTKCNPGILFENGTKRYVLEFRTTQVQPKHAIEDANHALHCSVIMAEHNKPVNKIFIYYPRFDLYLTHTI